MYLVAPAAGIAARADQETSMIALDEPLISFDAWRERHRREGIWACIVLALKVIERHGPNPYTQRLLDDWVARGGWPSPAWADRWIRDKAALYGRFRDEAAAALAAGVVDDICDDEIDEVGVCEQHLAAYRAVWRRLVGEARA